MEIEKSIGKTIKEFRKARNMTISQLSKIAKLSVSQLSRIESGKTSTPVSTLDTIAKILGTKVGFFFGEVEAKNDPRIVLTKSNNRIDIRKGMKEFGYNYSALAASKKNKMMDPFVLRIEKERNPDQTVVFNHQGEENIFVLEGKMLFTYENEQFHLEKGDCVYFDATGNHMVKNIGDTDLEFLIVICSP